MFVKAGLSDYPAETLRSKAKRPGLGEYDVRDQSRPRRLLRCPDGLNPDLVDALQFLPEQQVGQTIALLDEAGVRRAAWPRRETAGSRTSATVGRQPWAAGSPSRLSGSIESGVVKTRERLSLHQLCSPDRPARVAQVLGEDAASPLDRRPLIIEVLQDPDRRGIAEALRRLVRALGRTDPLSPRNSASKTGACSIPHPSRDRRTPRPVPTINSPHAPRCAQLAQSARVTPERVPKAVARRRVGTWCDPF